jgi:hypothetical protein
MEFAEGTGERRRFTNGGTESKETKRRRQLTKQESLSGILCVGHTMRSVDAPKAEIVDV